MPYAYGEENLLYLLRQKHISIQEHETSTEENEYEYLYEKDDEMKGHYITDENEGFVEYGNDFINCKIVLSKK